MRYITNNSSGKQGYAIAASLSQFGAKTTLISGPSNEPIPDGVKCIKIDTAKEMLDAVQSVSPADIGIFAAAVADWKVKNYSNQKIKKDRSVPSLELTENTNIIKTIENPTVNKIIGIKLMFFFSINSFNELPDMYEIYPGIKGNTHGDKKLIKPAPNAITSSIIYFFYYPFKPR